MKVEVRTARRYDGHVYLYSVELVIDGVIFKTPADDHATAIRLAAQVARALGVACGGEEPHV